MKYRCKYTELEAVRFEPDPAVIGRIRKLVGAENVRKESTFTDDVYYIKVDGVFIPLRESDYVFLRDDKITVRTVSRLLEDYEVVRE